MLKTSEAMARVQYLFYVWRNALTEKARQVAMDTARDSMLGGHREFHAKTSNAWAEYESGKDGRRHGACSGTPETFIEASLLQAVCAWDIRPLLASICGSCSSLCAANRGCFVPMCVSASVGSTPFQIASGGFVGRRGPPFLAFE